MSPRADRGTPEGRLKAQEDSKRHYYRNKEQYLARNRKKRATLSDFLHKYKEFKGCGDCGAKFPYYVLDFDHRDPTQKVFEPARLARQGSWDKMLEEIAKCDVVCANCHRVRTHEKNHYAHNNVIEDDFAPDDLGSSLSLNNDQGGSNV
jgi:ribosomal protein L35